MTENKYKPVRRVVTGHNEAGQAVFRSDDSFIPEDVPSGDAAMALLWTTETVPADNNDETDGREREAGLTLNGGSAIRTVDMYPGQQSPMHRTNSIDYGIVLYGELELELEDGAVTKLGPGDVVVQRGTIHLWRNPSETEICRIVFILIEAPAYKHNGQELIEDKPENHHPK